MKTGGSIQSLDGKEHLESKPGHYQPLWAPALPAPHMGAPPASSARAAGEGALGCTNLLSKEEKPRSHKV